MAVQKARGALELAALLGLGLGLTVLKWPDDEHTPASPAPDTHAPDTHAAGTRAPDLAGADADSPAGIPPRGWWQTGKRVAGDIVDHRILAEAAAVTFYALLAVFPALAALISLYGLIADPSTISAHLDGLQGVIPGGGLQIITDQIHTLTSTPHQALGLGAITGFLISLWSANAGVKSMFDALNAVYSERESRSFLHLTWLSLCFTIGILCFVIVAITAVIVLPTVLNYVGLGSTTDILLRLLRWPLLLVGIGLFLALVYRYGPSRKKAKWRWVSWGSAFASFAWIGASLAFSYYVANFGSYNKTYGSLGAAVGFMTWIWISTIIVLIGAELNAELEHQTIRKTTV
jgi:membrane protein